mgnify:CR=1 FL=1
MPRKPKNMIIISIHLPIALVEALDYLVENGIYPSRAEAIRTAVRNLVNEELAADRMWRLDYGHE